MGLEVVVKDVLTRGEEEANRIRQEGIDEANAIVVGAEKTAHQIREEKREQTTEQIERRKNREISSANLEVKRAILNAKKDLLDRVYNEAIEKLATLPESEREEIIKKLLESQRIPPRFFAKKTDWCVGKKIPTWKEGGPLRCGGGVCWKNEDARVLD